MPDQNKTFIVKANEFVFSIGDSEIDALDLIKISPTEFNLLKNHHSVNAKLVEEKTNGKKLKIEVDGELFDVEIKDELDQRLDEMGFNSTQSRQIKEIKAPMPGLVLQVFVKEGQEVKEGGRILILEAMKMENSITLQNSARIKKIRVLNGQAVEKGQVMIELEYN